jgi:cysteine desulfurase
MLYMDYAASTPPFDEVIETVTKAMRQYYGNPSSIHRKGLEAGLVVSQARKIVSRALACKEEEIIFTSGGTESNQTAIRGAAYQFQNRGKHIISSMIEHASVYECLKQLEAEGFEVTYLPVDASGAVRVEQVKEAIRPDTILVSVMHINNETGRIQPIEQIGTLLNQYPKIIFHVDAIQSMGKLDVKPRQSGIDLLSLSAHKFRGPKGSGALYVRSGIRLTPLLAGGGQEGGRRSGTENVPMIAGMARALKITMENREHDVKQAYHLRNRLIDQLSAYPEFIIIGSENEKDMAPHIVHFCFPGVRSEVMVHALEKQELYLSTRSACSSGDPKPSRVLKAMGLSDELAESGLRISFSPQHTTEDIDLTAKLCIETGKELRSIMEVTK